MNIVKIGIEGNIGAGKTTLIDNIKAFIYNNYKNIHVGILKEVINYNLLESFYNNPKEICNMLQVYIMNNSLNNDKMLDFAIQNNVLVDTIDNSSNMTINTERSMNEFGKLFYIKDRTSIGNFTFIVVNFLRGNINRESFKTFCILLNPYLFNNKYTYRMNKILYLDNHIDICIQNIEKRNRKGELTIDKEYLNNIDVIYFIIITSFIIKHKNIIVKTWDQYSSEIYMSTLFKNIVKDNYTSSICMIEKEKIDLIIDNYNIVSHVENDICSKLEFISNDQNQDKDYSHLIYYHCYRDVNFIYNDNDIMIDEIFDCNCINTTVLIPFPCELLPRNEVTLDLHFKNLFLKEDYRISDFLILIPSYLRRIIMKHLSLNHHILLYQQI